MSLSPKTKRKLISEAHALSPIVIIGQKGLTRAVTLETDQALNDHELIKIKINADNKTEKLAMAEHLCGELNAECLKIIGHIAIIYRKNPDK